MSVNKYVDIRPLFSGASNGTYNDARSDLFASKLLELQNITNGQIFIENKNITKLSPRDRDIAMIFQSYALYPHMTVYENLSIPLKRQTRSHSVVSGGGGGRGAWQAKEGAGYS